MNKEQPEEKPPPEFVFDHEMTPAVHYLAFKEKFT